MFLVLGLALISWTCFGLLSSNMESTTYQWGHGDPVIPDPPNSSDVQKLTEALYVDRPILYDKAFPRTKTGVDVCKLTTQEAMQLCRKVERLFKYSGSYFEISDGKVSECEVHKLKLHHTFERPVFKDVQARRCPFQPNALFIVSGNDRVPVFIFTWSDVEEKTHLHVDFYMNA